MREPHFAPFRAQVGGLALAALVVAVPSAVVASGGGQDRPVTAKKATSWAHPKTPWGDPDLQGMWPSEKMQGVPFERPESFGERAFLTDAEFARREAQLQETYARFVVAAWGESGKAQRQASLIVEPTNGRMPPLTAEGHQRSAAMGSSREDGPFNGPEDFDTWDRCITRGLLPSMLPGAYSNGIDIYQAPGYVVIRNEMVHEARIIPVDGRPHIGRALTQYMGDSRGHWEGNTLVVEVTSFNGRTPVNGSPRTSNIPTSASLRIVERFTRVDVDTIRYEARVEDPTIFTRPWTVVLPLRRDPQYQMFEYACHEGNYALSNILSNSRASDKATRREAAKP